MHRPTRHGTRRRARGFSLIELLAATAVLAILGAMAIPSFESLVNRNRLANASNEMLAFLGTARLEAVARYARVDLCRSDDGEHCAADATLTRGWMASRQDGAERRVIAATPMRFAVDMQLNQAAGNWRGYGPDGRMRTGGPTASVGRVRLCIPVARPHDNIRDVTIRASGRVEVIASSGNGACPPPQD